MITGNGPGRTSASARGPGRGTSMSPATRYVSGPPVPATAGYQRSSFSVRSASTPAGLYVTLAVRYPTAYGPGWNSAARPSGAVEVEASGLGAASATPASGAPAPPSSPQAAAATSNPISSHRFIASPSTAARRSDAPAVPGHRP